MLLNSQKQIANQCLYIYDYYLILTLKKNYVLNLLNLKFDLLEFCKFS